MTDLSHRNVLLITLDQWRADCLSILGHPCLKTPTLDALARDGVLFRRHYTGAVPCGPSRACLLTGLYLQNHRSVRNGTPLDARHTNVALEMRKAGYEPVLFGYTDTSPDPRFYAAEDPVLQTYEGLLPGFHPGIILPMYLTPWLAELKQKGYTIPDEPKHMWFPAPPKPGENPREPRFGPAQYPAEDSDTAFLTDATLRHLGQRKGKWFVHLSYLRPHPPFVAPAPYDTMYDPDAAPRPLRAATRAAEGRQHPWLGAHLDKLYEGQSPILEQDFCLADMTDRDIDRMRATYYGLITELDDNLARLFAALKADGSFEKTLIIITTDHGEQLGDHYLYGKDGYFEQTYNIPLIIRDPSRAADAARGTIVDAFTESVDIMPTILDWVGRDVPAACDGASLVPFLHGGDVSDWRREVHWEYDFRSVREPIVESALGLPSDHCTLNVIRDERWKYVHFTALPPLLFDLQNDPGEFTNLADDPAHQSILLRLAQKMLSWRMAHDERTLTHMQVGPGGVVSRLQKRRPT